jgi:signal recognition particle subunit SRP54
VGEKVTAFEPFHPERVASLILGMGDVLSLVEKAKEVMDQEESARLLKLMTKGGYTLDEFKKQMAQLKKVGSLESLLSMIPLVGRMKRLRDLKLDPKDLTRIEAIIDSMTKEERFNHNVIDASRRRRIAQGSGTTVSDVNQLIRNFNEMSKLMAMHGKQGDALRGMREIIKKFT